MARCCLSILALMPAMRALGEALRDVFDSPAYQRVLLGILLYQAPRWRRWLAMRAPVFIVRRLNRRLLARRERRLHGEAGM